jgi:hypothetical protein
MTVFRRALLFFIAVLVLPVVSPAARAWDSGGHELVAMMAVDRLNPKARQAVNELAREMVNPEETYDAVSIACWMDDLKKPNSAMPYHGMFQTWHYIDIPIDSRDPMPSFEPGQDNDVHGDVVQALKRALVVLKGGTDPYVKSKAMACAMVMHLVGDIHQPLHCATKYFISHHELHQDRGGNAEGVGNGPSGDAKFNLHAFWDAAYRASFDEVTGAVVLDPHLEDTARHDPDRFRALATSLEAEPPPADANLSPDFDAWAREGNEIARDFVYRELTSTESKKYCRLSSGYVAQANAIAKRRLVLAAWRLAALLNGTLGADQPVAPPPSYPAGPPAVQF